MATLLDRAAQLSADPYRRVARFLAAAEAEVAAGALSKASRLLGQLGRAVLDDRHRVTPIDRADVCINYDKQWFAEHDLEVPSSYLSLTAPVYEGLLVVENPATSSPGLAFMLATRATSLNDRSWHRWLTDLAANDVAVVDGWEQAWFERFTAVSENGDRPLVVSYVEPSGHDP